MTITQLTNNEISKSPDIFGDRIVWIENRNSVVLLENGATTVLPDLGVNFETNPQISADGVLWNGYVTRWQNFYYDGETTTQLTDSNSVYDEKLSGDNIAWRSAKVWSWRFPA